MANGNDTNPGLTREEFFDDELLAQFPQLASAVGGSIEGIFGDTGLSDEERAELMRLENRAQRLAPLAQPTLQGNNRIPGNPFSIDTSPVNNAISSGIVNVFNAIRQRRMLGDPEGAAAATEEAGELREAAGAQEGGREALLRARKLLSRSQQKEQEAADKQGVTGRLQELQRKEERGERAEELEMQTLARLFPDVAARLTTASAGARRDELKQDLTLEEIQKRHEARMKEINARYGEGGAGGGRGLSAAVLNTLSENVGLMQERVQQELNDLTTQELRIINAGDDPEKVKALRKRMPGEYDSLDDWLSAIEKEKRQKRQRLDTSTEEMIRVTAERNNLDEDSLRKLLGFQKQTITPQDVQSWADEHMGGDYDAAARWLQQNRNAVIKGNRETGQE